MLGPTREEDSKPSARAGGRKSRLTEEVHEAIIEGIKSGNYIATVMKSVGIPYQNYWLWKRLGSPEPVYDEQGNQIGEEFPDNFYGDFVRDLQEAEAIAEIRAVKSLQNHFDKDWRAAEAYLSRKHPERWNPKTVVEMSGKDGGPIEVSSSKDSLYERLDQIGNSEVSVIDIQGQETQALDSGSEPEQEPEQMALDLD